YSGPAVGGCAPAQSAWPARSAELRRSVAGSLQTERRMQRLLTNCCRIVPILAVLCLSTSVTAHPGSGIAVDRLGQVYFLDTGSGLWKIDGQGRLIRLSSKLFHWLALDANDRFASAPLPSSAGTGLDWEILRVGANPTVLIASDFPIALGQDGNLY